MFPLSSDADGSFLYMGVDVFGSRVRFRKRDGRHLTDDGGREVARRLLQVLMSLGLAAKPTTAAITREPSVVGAPTVC